MTDPLDKATSRAPATLGEGCLSRYDPDDLGPEDGTEFPDAAELWKQTHPDDQPDPAQKALTPAARRSTS
ncbi:hypothetical protein [Pseudomonas citrulli]|uniref:Uncharacterized protein n=1 Tax=Pseudomonas citrulli TaxID=3064347 RepID=A0ABT9BXH1_9PSED|nr:hypothetical protein [Pseudomonas sp. K18]MDO7897246.1 hypothetical protein [Pseudomonas sp. K18]